MHMKWQCFPELKDVWMSSKLGKKNVGGTTQSQAASY